MNRYVSEMIGTMVLVLMGCGSAVFAGDMPGAVTTGVGTLGVAIAFGLSVVAMAYAIGGISGCHINPAITLGMYCSGGMGGKDALLYIIFQIIGGILGSAVLFILVSTGPHAGPTMTGSNGFVEGEMLQAFIAEAVFTFIFVLVALGATDKKKGAGKLAGLVIGADACPGAYRMYSHHRNISKSRAQHRTRTFRGRRRDLTALAIYRRSTDRRSGQCHSVESHFSA